MIAIRTMWRRLVADQRGATAIEYGLICVAAIGGMQQLGGGVGGKWGNLASTMNTYMP